jgi:hypothetical protein
MYFYFAQLANPDSSEHYYFIPDTNVKTFDHTC